MDKIDPRSGLKLSEVANSGARDVELAIESASSALQTWRDMRQLTVVVCSTNWPACLHPTRSVRRHRRHSAVECPAPSGCASIAPALATGNVVVAKPSEHASASLVELARIAVEEAGISAGVFNVIVGKDSVIGPVMARHLWSTSTAAGLCRHPAVASNNADMDANKVLMPCLITLN